MRARTAAIALFWLVGCPHPSASKKTTPSADSFATDPIVRLGQLRTQFQSESLSCDARCQIAREGCDLARNACERLRADASDFDDGRCTSAQEDCAHFNDGCAQCQWTDH